MVIGVDFGFGTVVMCLYQYRVVVPINFFYIFPTNTLTVSNDLVDFARSFEVWKMLFYVKITITFLVKMEEIILSSNYLKQ